MTAISAPRGSARTTPFERALLRAASALDHFVAQRLERAPRPTTAARVDAQRRSPLPAPPPRRAARSGMLPR